MICWPSDLTVPVDSSLDKISREIKCPVDSKDIAIYLDSKDPFKETREEFEIPLKRDVVNKSHDPSKSINESVAVTAEQKTEASSEEKCLYFCGNSLGIMPKITKKLVNEELDVWSKNGVHGHFHHEFGRPWVSIDDFVTEQSAKIVGAMKEEVSILNSLSVNLHLLMVSFYNPSQKRNKILIENKAFPSDHYIVESQIKFHNYDPKSSLIVVKQREGESFWRTKDILDIIEKQGDEIALVLLSGVHYFTGQLFDIEKITKSAQKKGCFVGFDLAHAAGNVVLKLHEWNVDFAAWCTYKYLNSGPGSISGIFVHEKHHNGSLKRLNGWFGNKEETRFQMRPEFDPILSANGYRMSNPCVLAVVSLLGSLTVFEKTSIVELNKKSKILTGYLEYLLVHDDSLKQKVTILTPQNPDERGCQLSLVLTKGQDLKSVFSKLSNEGVVCDKREPDCIRVAPTPLYNTFADVWNFVQIFKCALK